MMDRCVHPGVHKGPLSSGSRLPSGRAGSDEGREAVEDAVDAEVQRVDEIMLRYAKIAGNSDAGRFMAPKTAWGIRGRNWLLGSRAFGLMMRYGDKAANDIDLADYPALAGAGPEHG
jgi:hypothetical protein